MINWKNVLTNNKFWAAVIAFITALLTALNYDNYTIEQIVTIIVAGASVIGIILGKEVVIKLANKKEGKDK